MTTEPRREGAASEEGGAPAKERPQARDEPSSPRSGAAAGAMPVDLSGLAWCGGDATAGSEPGPPAGAELEMGASEAAAGGEAARGDVRTGHLHQLAAGDADPRAADRPPPPAERGGVSSPRCAAGSGGGVGEPVAAAAATWGDGAGVGSAAPPGLNATSTVRATAGTSAGADDGEDESEWPTDADLLQPGEQPPHNVVKLKCRGIRAGGYRWELKSAPPPHDVESSSCPRKAAAAPTAPARLLPSLPRDAAWHAVSAVATELVAQIAHPHLRLSVAYTDEARTEALKLFRDLNHLSLRGGISCERVVAHASSHTVLLHFKEGLHACAATFDLSEDCVMLRLLATHPRMTRHGFGRVVIHFLKELGRALGKVAIVAYTYPNAQPFYEARARVPVAPASAHARARACPCAATCVAWARAAAAAAAAADARARVHAPALRARRRSTFG